MVNGWMLLRSLGMLNIGIGFVCGGTVSALKGIKLYGKPKVTSARSGIERRVTPAKIINPTVLVDGFFLTFK